MCLYTNKEKPEVAEEDITVYKYVKKVREASGKVRLMSPYTEKIEYTEDTLIKDPLFRPTADLTDDGRGEFRYEVSYGLHSFGSKEDAVDRAKISRYLDAENCVVECVIPKGARYWKGGELINYYCSDELYVKGIVEEFTCDEWFLYSMQSKSRWCRIQQTEV